MRLQRRLERVRPTAITLSAAKIVLLYAVFAALWILLSDKIVGLIFADPAYWIIASTLKGWLFVLVTTLLLFGAIVRLGRRLAARDPNDPWIVAATTPLNTASDQDIADPSFFARIGFLIPPFLLLATLIIASTLGAVTHTFRHQKAKEVDRLQAIAELQVGRISAWFRERYGDAEFVRTSRFLTDSYDHRLSNAGEPSSGREQLRRQLTDYQNIYFYQKIFYWTSKATSC